MADDTFAPAPTPTMGDLFATYNPNGAANGLFAPAFIKGYAPSEQAVVDWTKAHRTDPSIIDETRMATRWSPPDVTQTAPGVWGPSNAGGVRSGDTMGTYGEGRIPQNLTYTGDVGEADFNALKAVAQGTAYTGLEARRNKIAERLASNEGAMDAYQMRANARGEPGLTGGKIIPGSYGSGDLYTKYMQQYNPKRWDDPLIINNNPGGEGYVRGPIDNGRWPANVSGQPTSANMAPLTPESLAAAQAAAKARGGGMGSAANLNIIDPTGNYGAGGF